MSTTEGKIIVITGGMSLVSTANLLRVLERELPGQVVLCDNAPATPCQTAYLAEMDVMSVREENSVMIRGHAVPWYRQYEQRRRGY